MASIRQLETYLFYAADVAKRNKLETMYEMYLRELAKYNPEIGWAANKDTSPEPYRHMAAEEIMACTRPDTDIWIYKAGDQDVAFSVLGRWPNAFSRHDLFVQEMFVLPEHRRKGVGTAVAKHILGLAKEDISMFILEDNEVAQAFWQKTMVDQGYEERTAAGGLVARIENNSCIHWKYYIKTSE